MEAGTGRNKECRLCAEGLQTWLMQLTEEARKRDQIITGAKSQQANKRALFLSDPPEIQALWLAFSSPQPEGFDVNVGHPEWCTTRKHFPNLLLRVRRRSRRTQLKLQVRAGTSNPKVQVKALITCYI